MKKPPLFRAALFILTVGAAGFEPATSRTRTVRATGLRYAPMNREYTADYTYGSTRRGVLRSFGVALRGLCAPAIKEIRPRKPGAVWLRKIADE